MQLDKLDIKLRERTPWEAVDLGFALLRKYRLAVFLPWLVLFLTVATTCFCLPIDVVTSFFILMIFTPAIERVCLFVLSRSVFGQKPTFKQSLKAWPSECKAGFFSMNLFWRFFPSRSFMLPVWQLESLKGGQNSKRRSALSGSMGMVAGAAGFFFCLFESMLILGVIVFIIQFTSESYQMKIFNEISETGSFPEALWSTVYWSYVMVVALIRPFYMACGFTLYLSRRMELEGWDIEVRFRSLVQRLAKTATLFVLIFFTTLPSFSATLEGETSLTTAKETIAEVMKDDDFHEMKKERVRKDSKEERRKMEESSTEIPGLGAFAVLIKFVVIGAIVILLGYLLYHFFTNWKNGSSVSKVRAKRPQTILGFDLNDETLPDDLIAAVRELWMNGDIRGAFSLLYRGALIQFIDDYEVELRDGFTEGDCLRAIKGQSNAKPASYFEKLTHHWCMLAYAHITPDDDILEEFCQTWPLVFTPPNSGGKS